MGGRGRKNCGMGWQIFFGGDMAKYFGVGRQEIFEGGAKKILVGGNFLGAGRKIFLRWCGKFLGKEQGWSSKNIFGW